ncbi:hypothetical protein VF21_09535 [Pseudogymnoascus sp. 05NY08]|nr:hypothetical protein VF21_09535 [Pseudogymnoascus sp. 05NY08]
MSRSPELELPVTPSPFGAASVASTSRPRTVRPYQSPSVKDAPEEDEVAAQLAAKEMRTALGWKVSARYPVPESASPLRAGSRNCCVKSWISAATVSKATTSTFQSLLSLRDAGLAGDSKDTCEALATLLSTQREFTTALKGKEPRTPKSKDKKAATPVTRGLITKTKALRAAAAAFYAATNAALDAY